MFGSTGYAELVFDSLDLAAEVLPRLELYFIKQNKLGVDVREVGYSIGDE